MTRCRGTYVELALESGKSYVGFPVRTATAYAASPEAVDVELIPMFSGYRTHDTRELHLTRTATISVSLWIEAIEREGLSPRDFRVVVPLRQSARLFDPDIHKKMNSPKTIRTGPEHTN